MSNSLLVSLFFLIFGLAGCTIKSTEPMSQQDRGQTDPSVYEVSVVRTDYGIPHITANDFSSLGFGEGFVAAEDHICNIAHSIVSANGQRSRYHGMGEQKQHFLSDVVIQALEIPQRAKIHFEQLEQETKSWLQGYAAGFNHYLAETGVNNIGSWCQGEAWVTPITGLDIYMRALALANTAPRVPGMLVSAQPPATTKVAQLDVDLEYELETLKGKHLGSNAWAFGRDRSENGKGLLMGNPHYPWSGSDRFWEKHLIIPGKLDVYGVHLIGAPGIGIGFNKNIGWTHTVSDSERTVFYRLNLVPGQPTKYYYDDGVRSMISKTVKLSVKGKKEPVEHTVWFSHYGPIVQLPGVPWSETMVLSMKDANLNNYGLLNQWKEMAQAGSMDEFIAVHKKWNAMPWVNTIATSADGRAVYIDGSNVGRLSEQAIKLWKKQVKIDKLTAGLYAKQKLIVLDGSDSRFEWQSHPESVMKGNVPFIEKPLLDRTDYVFNANDSYWLSHVEEPMKEYSPLFGPHSSARTLRTRMNAQLVSNNATMGYAGMDSKFSAKEMQQAILGNDSLSARLLKSPLVEACRATSQIEVDTKLIDLTPACEVLAGYDAQLNLESKGAVLFREWISQYSYAETFIKGSLFVNDFRLGEPVHTPNGLANSTLALGNLAKAMMLLSSAGIPLDASLADTQFAYRGSHKIAIHGGKKAEGVANFIGQRVYDTQAKQIRGKSMEGSEFLKDLGYPITFGTSFLYTLSYTEQGPEAEAFLTYGQSGNPDSEHYTDQTYLFSDKKWRPILFKPEDIATHIKQRRSFSHPRK